MRQLLLFIVFVTVAKAATAAQLEPIELESFHWIYAQHPALGYGDHPPMAPWFILLSTALFGDGLLGFRLVSIAAGSLTIWLAFVAGRRLYGEREGRLAALIVGVVPFFFGWGSRPVPDCPLELFWMATFWALAHALAGDRPAWWYAAGAFLGLAMLSKYHSIFIPVGVLAFLALSPDHRPWLRRPHPYLAALVALLVFSPALVWNAQNEWASFVYQGTARFREPGIPALKRLTQYPFSHLVLFTPFICGWAWVAGARVLRTWRTAAWQDRLAASLSMPVLIFFLLLAFTRPIKDHWPTPGYVTLLVLSAAAVARGGPWGRRLHHASIVALAAGVAALPIVLALLPPTWKTCWSSLAREVRARSPDFVLGRETMTAAAMSYQLRPLPCCDFAALGGTTTRLAPWWRPQDLAGKDAVIVYEAYHWPERRDELVRAFAEVGEPTEIVIPRNGNVPARWVILRARGYRPP